MKNQKTVFAFTTDNRFYGCRVKITLLTTALFFYANAVLISGQSSTLDQLQQHYDLQTGDGVTGRALLSDWHESLASTPVDTPVYIMAGSRPGATALIIAGTHANELAGPTAVRVIMESQRVSSGRLILIPHANRSALETRDSRVGMPLRYPVESASGRRILPIGDRHSSYRHQSPDPRYYINIIDRNNGVTSADRFARKPGYEARNLNRVYPGVADGTMTEQLAFAIMQLIRAEQVDYVLDMHEARTNETYTDSAGRQVTPFLADSIFYHPDGEQVADNVDMLLRNINGLELKVRQTGNLRHGSSHNEIAEAGRALSFLSETGNPGQDHWRVNTDPVFHPDHPLSRRVAIQLAVFQALTISYGMVYGAGLTFVDYPSLSEVTENGFIHYLK